MHIAVGESHGECTCEEVIQDRKKIPLSYLKVTLDSTDVVSLIYDPE